MPMFFLLLFKILLLWNNILKRSQNSSDIQSLEEERNDKLMKKNEVKEKILGSEMNFLNDGLLISVS